jgi:hypothetical protein
MTKNGKDKQKKYIQRLNLKQDPPDGRQLSDTTTYARRLKSSPTLLGKPKLQPRFTAYFMQQPQSILEQINF